MKVNTPHPLRPVVFCDIIESSGGKKPKPEAQKGNEMTTIQTLAAEFDMQPYEMAALLDLGTQIQTEEISAEDEQWMREAIAESMNR